MLKKLKTDFVNYLYRDFIGAFTYELGLIKLTDERKLTDKNLINQVQWVKGCPKTSWFADPFIYKITDTEIYIFAEEWIYSLGRGILSLVVVDKASYQYIRHKELLRLDTHLSWPYIIRENGKIFVVPENNESGKTRQYCYDELKEELVFDKVLADMPFVDPIFYTQDKQNYCSASFGVDLDNCFVYETNQDRIVQNDTAREVVFPEKIARAAGDYFDYKGKRYRANQIGNYFYGEGVVLFEQQKSGRLQEVVRFFHPKGGFRSYGIHTFNLYDNYIVIDGSQVPSLKGKIAFFILVALWKGKKLFNSKS